MPKRDASYRPITWLYDAEYLAEPMLAMDVPFALSVLGRRPVRVLEIGAGTGRAAIPIAQAGHRVVGVDHAADAVARAREKAAAVGLTEAACRFVVGDVRRLRLSERFDAALCLFNTFAGMEAEADQDALLRSAWRHLRPGGSLLIDVFNPDPARLATRVSRDVPASLFFVPELGRSVMRQVRITQNRGVQSQTVRFEYSWHDDAGRLKRATNEFRLTYLFPRELALRVERNGFVVKQIAGDYDGAELAVDSPRILLLARRV